MQSSLKPVGSMTAQNNWLPTSFGPPYFGVDVGTLSGNTYDTLRFLTVRTPNAMDRRLDNWSDGRPVGAKMYADGDGTVLTESSQLPGARNMVLPLTHTGLVTDMSGIYATIRFLNTDEFLTPLSISSPSPQQETRVKPNQSTSALFIIVEGANATLADKNGSITSDTDGQITILDPYDDVYTLTVTPKVTWWWKMKYKIIVAQLFEDGTMKWKTYTRHGPFEKHFKLHFDRHHKDDDVLNDK